MKSGTLLLAAAATAATALRALPPLSPTTPRCTLCVQRVAPLRLAATTPPASADDSADELMQPGDAAALVAGTAIGGGFLALPAVTSQLGFFPSAAALVGVWAFLALTGIAFVEAVATALEAARAEGEPDALVSVPSLTERAFGLRASLVCSAAFGFQMLAVATAQVVKAGEVFSLLAAQPYPVGCLGASALFGAFTFLTRTSLVERANTVLTVMLIGGFALLVALTLGSLPEPAVALGRLGAANWAGLLPQAQAAWAIPIFLNLLCFGQAIPLVVARSIPQRQQPGADAAEVAATGAVAVVSPAERLRSTRSAVLVGSIVPLLLSLVWAGVTSAAFPVGAAAPGGGSSDPVLLLVTSSVGTTALAARLLCAGAIGTTLIATYLTVNQFAVDFFCTLQGGCSVDQERNAKLATVALPALLACGGPTLYLPLLAFAGAGPTTLLFGLVPPLAALRFRSGGGSVEGKEAAAASEGPLLPGGAPLLLGLAALAVAMLTVSAGLAATALLPL